MQYVLFSEVWGTFFDVKLNVSKKKVNRSDNITVFKVSLLFSFSVLNKFLCSLLKIGTGSLHATNKAV